MHKHKEIKIENKPIEIDNLFIYLTRETEKEYFSLKWEGSRKVVFCSVLGNYEAGVGFLPASYRLLDLETAD